ncbi:uncharacterized protein LOC131840895 [Achroia grisella]|uniref:uncharacterized protein LOC131840895 n=1 Tax=Achroia grisella TaxID=688607 RepID=UPI0027D3210C|nr:uncharacterized protein LOC131840895 [Achroia grisella]
MGEQAQNETSNLDIYSGGGSFDNLTILKEFSNIANIIKNEDFLETVPKAKLRRVKWVPMFNCLKQGILDEMVQELNTMWTYENIAMKLEVLEKQKEKFSEMHLDKKLWRPQLDDVKAQLKASDCVNLQKQKVFLESLAKEYEARVTKLKKTISAKRGYLKALQLDIQKYQRKNEDFIIKIDDKLENHENLIKSLIPNKIPVDEIVWSDIESENNE